MYTRIMDMFIVHVIVWTTLHPDNMTILRFLVSWRVCIGVRGAGVGALLFRALALRIDSQFAFRAWGIVYIDRYNIINQLLFFFTRNCEVCRREFIILSLLSCIC